MSSSPNRRARRQARRQAEKASPGLVRAGTQVVNALEALQRIQGLEGTAKMLDGLGTEIERTRTLVEAMVRDMETLNAELAAQREINFRLLAHVLTGENMDENAVLENLRQSEETIRASVLSSGFIDEDE
jgi:hypothetical protein